MLGQVAYALLDQLVLDVEGVLEGGSLARACAVPHADEQGLAFARFEALYDPGELLRGLACMRSCANRPRVPIWAKPWGCGEVQFWPRGVDQVVILQLADFAGAIRVGVAHSHVGARVLKSAFAVQCQCEGLVELDSLAAIHRGKGECHLLGRHLADAHPDVRWNPIPLRVGRYDDDIMPPVQLTTKVQSRRMPGDTGTQDDGASHGDLLSSGLTSEEGSMAPNS